MRLPTPLREMLSAAHVLLSSERIANEEELLVSTCAEVLSEGPASLDAIHHAVNTIWPGARLSKERIQIVLARAAESGLIATQETLAGTDWALTKVGLVEVEATSAWYSDALNRLAAQDYKNEPPRTSEEYPLSKPTYGQRHS